MPIPKEVAELIKRFELHQKEYMAGAYNEMQLRQEFVDPLFAALGWDMVNKRGLAGPYKEVVHEDSMRIGGAHKAPDYAFRIGGERKFFVETKRPSVNLRDDPAPAFQLRRYAWSAKLPLSILTDFAEFAVYDTSVKPNQNDKASTARVFYTEYANLPKVWGDLEARFSYEAALSGAFDKYAESMATSRTGLQVDEAFLSDIEAWRELLAKNIATRNPSLDTRDLNRAVQRTIDRIIFLRICEDRGVEPYGQLRDVGQKTHSYSHLQKLFTSADERYNSGLFHFAVEKGRNELPDELTPGLTIDDSAIHRIIDGLYFPKSPYEFAVIPADILGQVYERFLGKVIRLTASHRAVVEEKPEVRKAGGVYYTPTFIVRYIVSHTVGHLLEGKTPKQAAEIKILDPACGSGSFLIGAYQYLIDWHLRWYATNDPAKWSRGAAPRLYLGKGSEWRLTTRERKRLLLSSIFGVDVDDQAVEVTKLSLLLKVLEGETADSLEAQLRLFRDRALPDLGNNIKCGNALVGRDFFDARQTELLNDEAVDEMNAFDWEAEFEGAFAGKNPGFQAVIGNPPYLNAVEERTRYSEQVNEYLRDSFESARGTVDASILFQELGVRLIARGGRTSLIVPNKFLAAPFGSAFRKYALRNANLRLLADYSAANVFKGVGVYPVVYVLESPGVTKKKPTILLQRFEADTVGCKLAAEKTVKTDPRNLDTWTQLFSSGWSLLDRLKASFPVFGDRYEITASASAGEAYEIKPCVTDAKPRGAHFKFVTSGAIDRFQTTHGKVPIRYLKSAYRSPYLADSCSALSENRRRQYASEKIIIAGMTKRLEAIWDDGQIAGSVPTVQILRRDNTNDGSLLYELGLINSTLLNWVFNQYYSSLSLAGGYLRIGVPQISTLPLRVIDPRDKGDRDKRDRIIDGVRRMMALLEQQDEASVQRQKLIAHQVESLDGDIDQIVYGLYGLTPTEIAMVEGPSAMSAPGDRGTDHRSRRGRRGSAT